jgi:hydrogenase nickel incorporation protein HypA/HybF
MHEYSLMTALMERVEEEASSRRALAVHRVTVRIGELSGVEPDLLASAFDIVRAGTICAGAELSIERVAARWVCPDCGQAIDPSKGGPRCGPCGRPAGLAAGDEILLGQIELEVP